MSKTDKIRRIVEAGETRATKIVERLAKRGVTVAPSQVYNVLSKSRGSAQRVNESTSKPARVSQLESVVALVNQCGGLQAALDTLRTLKELKQ